MNESEWMNCNSVFTLFQCLRAIAWRTPMDFFRRRQRHKWARKYLLFAHACCRQLLPILNDFRAEQAVIYGEQFLDGKPPPCESETVVAKVREGWRDSLQLLSGGIASQIPMSIDKIDAWRAVWTSARATFPEKRWIARIAARDAAFSVWKLANTALFVSGLASNSLDSKPDSCRIRGKARQELSLAIEKEHADYVRDIFGNPFRRTVFQGMFRDDHIQSIARLIYENKRYGDLPILADLLEESGILDQELISHCRSRSVHVKGCWALDWILGHQVARLGAI
jgi:hypothetical protein